MLQTAEPGSRRLHRQQGSRSALRTGPSVPGGPGLCFRRRWGLTSHGVDHGSGGLGKGTRGNTPNLWRFSAVVKCTPAVPFFSLPSSRGRREGPPQAKSLSVTFLQNSSWNQMLCQRKFSERSRRYVCWSIGCQR
ncbi:uncharacterized protein LOC144330299 isoform X2 [Macaca mulatta]